MLYTLTTKEGEERTVDVSKHLWYWIAKYTDGTSLPQLDAENKRFHQIYEIDRTKLHTLSLQSREHPERSFDLVMQEGMKFIVFTKINHELKTWIDKEGKEQSAVVELNRVFCIGHEVKVRGETCKTILEVQPNGQTLIISL